MERDERSELLARLRRGHRLLFDAGRYDPGWRSALTVGNQVRGHRRWDPAIAEALLAEGFIAPRAAPSERAGVTNYELTPLGRGA